jgi:hypothetical protein
MDWLEVNTSFGPIPVAGRIHAERRPTLLFIPGAFAPRGLGHELIDQFPAANVLVTILPGMLTKFDDLTPPAYSAAYDEIVQKLVPGTPLIVRGSSTGCIVALGMSSSEIQGHVLEEPFFTTANLWPLVSNFQKRLRNNLDNTAMAKFMWEFFGYASDSVMDRNYRELAARIAVPTEVLVGQSPLEPPRNLDAWPSFTSAADRELLAAHPHVSLHVGPDGTGHAIRLSAEAANLSRLLCLASLSRAARAMGFTGNLTAG